MSRGEKVGIGKFFQAGLDQFWQLLGAVTLMIVGVGIGFVLFIIPGIYLMVSWLFVLYFMMDKKVNISDAFKLSKEIVKGRWWEVFVLVILVEIIESIACLTGIGVLVAIPIGILIMIQFYLDAAEEVR